MNALLGLHAAPLILPSPPPGERDLERRRPDQIHYLAERWKDISNPSPPVGERAAVRAEGRSPEARAE
jgi:hypothetical protein